MKFDQIRINLDRAKAVYQQALTSIDSTLRAVVSQDPTALAEAQDLQASYVEGFTVAELAAAEQPAQALVEGHTATRLGGRHQSLGNGQTATGVAGAPKAAKPKRVRKAAKAK